MSIDELRNAALTLPARTHSPPPSRTTQVRIELHPTSEDELSFFPMNASARLNRIGHRNPNSSVKRLFFLLLPSTLLLASSALAQESVPTLEELKATGALRSSYLKKASQVVFNEAPQTDLNAFRKEIEPRLRATCYQCHGPKKQKGKFRVDTLDPDLIQGSDADWWLEVMDVLSNNEMPPEDEDVELADADRGRIIDWLSSEIQVASQVRRSEQGHSSFRRMTRYEYNYALQDLLGLPYDFASDLPPETYSEDGFENSSELLRMSVMQFETYRELGRKALQKATIRGERPELIYYGIPMETAAAQMGKLKASNRFRQSSTHFKNLLTNESIKSTFNYHAGKLSHSPSRTRPEIPPVSPYVLILPANNEQKFDLGDKLPDTGILRVRVRASRASTEDPSPPALRLKFWYQPSNDSRNSERVDNRDVAILASPQQPQF